MGEPAQRSRPNASVLAAATGLMAALVALRALTEHDPYPYWQHDPFVFGPPITGLLGGYGALLNAALCVLGAAIVWLCRGVLRWWQGAALALGGVFLAAHIARDPANLDAGSTLAGAMGVLVASMGVVTTEPRARRLILPAALGLLVVLALEGMHQIFVQHPETVAYFETNKEEFLAARGWEPGSFQARSYERRLRQPEPTAMFGLANVFGGLMAGATLATALLWMMARDRVWRSIGGGLVLVFGSALVLSGAKGAIGALVIGGVVIAADRIAAARGRRIPSGALALGGGVALMLGVVLGGALGQLSLVFRRQYMHGALRIWGEHPILGVGPGRFQDAYTIHKPRTSPEDVASAHNVLFDLVAQLGAGGIAWIVVLITLVAGSVGALAREEGSDPPARGAGTLTRAIGLGVLVVMVLAVRIRAPVLDMGHLALIGAGTLVWITLASLGAARPLSGAAARSAAWGGAVVLALHALFDLGPVWVVSAPLWAMFIGIGLCQREPSSRRRVGGIAASGALLLLGGVIAWAAVPRIATQLELVRLGETAASHARLRGDLRAGDAGEPRRAADLERRIEAITGRAIPLGSSELGEALGRAMQRDRRRLARELIELAGRSEDPRVTRTALEQTLMVVRDDPGGPNEALWAWALPTGDRLAERAGDLDALRWSGRIALARAEAPGVGDAEADRLTRLALERWTQADALAPHDPSHAVRLMDLALSLDRPALATRWAERALERSEAMRLDPLRQLPGPVERRVRRVVPWRVIAGAGWAGSDRPIRLIRCALGLTFQASRDSCRRRNHCVSVCLRRQEVVGARSETGPPGRV